MSAKFSTTMACIDSMVAAIKASSSLTTLVSGLCGGRRLAFWIGYDEKKLPPLSEAPYVVLMPSQGGRSEDWSHQIHGVQVAVVTEAEEPTNTAGVIRYAALETNEKIAKAIDAALESWMATNFNDGTAKTPFISALPLPAAKTVWTYEFQDQL